MILLYVVCVRQKKHQSINYYDAPSKNYQFVNNVNNVMKVMTNILKIPQI